MKEKKIKNRLTQLNHQEQLIYMKHGVIVRHLEEDERYYVELIATAEQISAAVKEIGMLMKLDQKIDAIQDIILTMQHDKEPTLEKYQAGCKDIFSALRDLRGDIKE